MTPARCSKLHSNCNDCRTARDRRNPPHPLQAIAISLDACLKAMRNGDTPIVWKLDRMVRLAAAAIGKHEANLPRLRRKLGVSTQTLYRYASPRGAPRTDAKKALGTRTDAD